MNIYKNARIITMNGQEVIENGVLVVKDNRIVKVCDAALYNSEELEEGNPRVIDCAGKTIMPGLINSHSHITLWRSFGDITMEKDIATEALMACRNALNCIRKGITTIRDMGHNDHVHNEMKKAVKLGIVLSPRMYCAVGCIEMSHGHANHFCHCVGSPYELVAEIRRQVNCGTDFIKLIASHDDLYHLKTEEYAVPWFSEEDLKLAVQTAHEAYTRVAVHANGRETIRRALNAQVDCLEHGIGMTDELACQMKQQGTYYVPTLTGYLENGRSKWRRGEEWTARYNDMWKLHEKSFVKAVEAGVTLVAGTDTLGDLNEEIALFCKYGLSEHEALASATINAARLIGVEDQIGSLEEGKFADFIILEGDPLKDIGALYNVQSVSVNGRLVNVEAINEIVPNSPVYIQGW